MCLTPVRLRTNAKYFSVSGYKRFYMDVPCGKCSECQQMKKNEWYVRNYYEAQDTWLKNGYILFDTLTYADEFLPSVSEKILGFSIDDLNSSDALVAMNCIWKIYDWMIDNGYADKYDLRDFVRLFKTHNFSCFNYLQVQNFLKLLRIRLERAGYDVKNKVRYFLSSEYGHDQTYVDNYGHTRKGTNRPHYHVLFYITDPNLDPLTLSQFISDAWIYGRTDGYAYRGRAYVFNNTFGPRYIKDPNRLAGVQYYTTKYVCKDYEFFETIDTRISGLLRDVYHLAFSSSEYLSTKRELHRFMDQFHRQSLGFGLSALNHCDVLDSIYREGNIILPDKEKIVKKFSVPMYYIRKLFQRCVKDSGGTLHWIWNSEGVEWRKNRIISSVSLLATKMQDWYNNLSVYSENADNYRRKVDDILDSRSWLDYAKYLVYYRHRIYDGDVPTVDDILNNSLTDNRESGEGVFQKYGDGYYLSDVEGEKYFVSVEDIMNNCLIDDTVLPEFRGFDFIYSLYCSSMRKWNDLKEKTYREKLEYQKRLKQLGLKCKRS